MSRASHRDVLAAISAIASSDTEDALIVVGEVGLGKNQILHSALAASVIRGAIVRSLPGESAFPLTGSRLCSMPSWASTRHISPGSSDCTRTSPRHTSRRPTT